jgi:hypothetical protein
MSDPWPYNLPIFRRSHRALSPNGNDSAEIQKAYEVSMSNPTCGTLQTDSGLELENCSPSFLWSDDSRYLAVPQFFRRFNLFRRQRIVIIDIEECCGYLSPEIAFYFQPESFKAGLLQATREPFKTKKMIQWQVPECLESFSRFEPHWKENAQQAMDANRSSSSQPPDNATR